MIATLEFYNKRDLRNFFAAALQPCRGSVDRALLVLSDPGSVALQIGACALLLATPAERHIANATVLLIYYNYEMRQRLGKFVRKDYSFSIHTTYRVFQDYFRARRMKLFASAFAIDGYTRIIYIGALPLTGPTSSKSQTISQALVHSFINDGMAPSSDRWLGVGDFFRYTVLVRA